MIPKQVGGFFRSGLAIAATVTVVFLIVAAGAGFFLVHFYSDYLWYEQLGYTEVLLTQWFALSVVFLVVFILAFGLILTSMLLAYRFRPRYSNLSAKLTYYQETIDPIRRLVTVSVSLLGGVLFGAAAASQWDVLYVWLNRVEAGRSDPVFGYDISFYLFELPFYRLLITLLLNLLLIGLVFSVIISVVYGALRISGREVWLSKGARIQYSLMAFFILVLMALGFWLDRFETLLSERSDIITGVAYVEINALIPGYAVLSLIVLAVAALFLITAFLGKWRLPSVGVSMTVIVWLVVTVAVPWGIQRFQVDPNARVLEAEYIKHNIEQTRFAYGISEVDEVAYSARTDAQAGQLRNDAQTTANIRILDPGLVSRAFGQLQQFRQYYTFGNDLAVDRYLIGDKTQDAVVAVRELNLAGLGAGNSWVNQTLVYTHGYGLAAAYGNDRTVDGEPKFFESGIPVTGTVQDYEPRIYFGRKSPRYSIVGSPDESKKFEFDYPANTDSDGQAYTTFQGSGGPKLDNFFKRLVFSLKFGSEQILLSDQVGDYSQILYNRDPIERVNKVAPYLRLDGNPYPSVVDGRVLWIIDGYTTSDRFPYSSINNFTALSQDSQSSPAVVGSGDNINYIRNSVKATVDAYSGEVKLYAWDTQDPILQVWQKIFPSNLRPIQEISGDLMSHLRYPLELFNIQRQVLARYHVTDPGAFFSHEDAWGIPVDPQRSESGDQMIRSGKTKVVSSAAQPPYYLTLKMPGQESAGYSIYSVFIPRSTGENSRSVLTGYLSANSDAGRAAGQVAADYGKLTLLRLSKDQTVPGPGQIQNSFDSDPLVGNQLNILRQGGQSRVLQGNLLTLPVGGGFLYVQPVYVQSTGSTSYTLLQKVLAAFGNKIAFENTLDEALDSLFAGDSGASAGDASSGSAAVTPAEDGGDSSGDASAEAKPDGAKPDASAGKTGSGKTGTKADASLLEQIKRALAEKISALNSKDLVKYSQADKELNQLLERYFKE